MDNCSPLRPSQNKFTASFTGLVKILVINFSAWLMILPRGSYNSWHCLLTKHFTILEPENPRVDIFIHKVRWYTDFEALK